MLIYRAQLWKHCKALTELRERWQQVAWLMLVSLPFIIFLQLIPVSNSPHKNEFLKVLVWDGLLFILLLFQSSSRDALNSSISICLPNARSVADILADARMHSMPALQPVTQSGSFTVLTAQIVSIYIRLCLYMKCLLHTECVCQLDLMTSSFECKALNNCRLPLYSVNMLKNTIVRWCIKPTWSAIGGWQSIFCHPANRAVKQHHALTGIALHIRRELPNELTLVPNELINADDAGTVSSSKLHWSRGTGEPCIVEEVHKSPAIRQQITTNKWYFRRIVSHCDCWKYRNNITVTNKAINIKQVLMNISKLDKSKLDKTW